MLIPTPKAYLYSRANWDNFKDDNQLTMTNLPDVSRATLEEIDEALDTWMTTVKTTADRRILQKTT